MVSGGFTDLSWSSLGTLGRGSGPGMEPLPGSLGKLVNPTPPLFLIHGVCAKADNLHSNELPGGIDAASLRPLFKKPCMHRWAFSPSFRKVMSAVETWLLKFLQPPSPAGFSPYDRRGMLHSRVTAAKLVLPLWTCNWVHSAGKEERGLESKWNASHRQAKCQGEWRQVGFFPSESRPRETYGGGNLRTVCKVEYFTEGSNYTAIGKCRHVEQNPVGLQSSLLFTRREMGAGPWNARLGIFFYLGVGKSRAFE